MTATVTRLDDYRPHVGVFVKCMSCAHTWKGFAVAPNPMVYLQCPACGCNAGMKQGTFEADGLVRVCDCGSTAYCLKAQGGAFCINCGLE